MRRPKRGRGCGIGTILALMAFFGAVMCISFFSIKILLAAVAVVFIVLGLFLIKL